MKSDALLMLVTTVEIFNVMLSGRLDNRVRGQNRRKCKGQKLPALDYQATLYACTRQTAGGGGLTMRRITVCLFAIFLAALAWAGDVPLVGSSLVPAAAGRISYEHDRNGNIKLDIKTKHLAAPERLTPAKNSYVVWIRSNDGQTQNAGVLKVNDNLEGSFITTTPIKAFDVVITAEDSPSVSQPSGPEVMHGSIQVH